MPVRLSHHHSILSKPAYAVKGAGTNAFSTTEISNGSIAPEAFENDADLLSSELAASDAFDIPDESLRLFGPGLSLPGLV